MIDFPRGSVWLVGAGPGDPELLTCKAERLLAAATVVYHDALVSAGVLALCNRGARLVHVGKRAGRHSHKQASIDWLIVASALAGERVVRLKGGDPAVFGRTAEEVAACRAAGVEVRICPGITAASGAAASLGTSLTLRGSARKLTFVTAHCRAGEHLGLDLAALADPEATLVIYMGKAVASRLSTGLMRCGLPRDTPAALVESATMPAERSIVTTLGHLGQAAADLGDGPAILLIGAAFGHAREGGDTARVASRPCHAGSSQQDRLTRPRVSGAT